jgi:carbamoyltransferase
MGTDIDYLAVGNCVLHKDAQDPTLKRDYSTQFEPD